MSSERIVDLFAGPGGWSEGLRELGYSEVGIEIDETACATAIAAGHQRVQADVAALDPADFAPCWGLIGSPPCPTFSAAGKGAGRRDVDHVIACALELGAGTDFRGLHRMRCEDERSMLTIEPLRWALALRPRWITLEQVPPVLELWTLYAHILEQHGYSAWTGVLEAERYGVPQTRERAILIASLDGLAHPPRPTHQRFVSGEGQRHDVTLDGEILPWVSMAEALGWGMTERPCVTVPADMHSGWVEAGSGSRATVRREFDRDAWTVKTGNFTARDFRGQEGVPYVRPVSDPAPTVTTTAARWTFERPSTTVQCDSRIAVPGHKADPRVDPSAIRQMEGAIIVTPREAAILQGFREDYPWQGTTKEAVFRQIGNAVPPPLAAAVLGTVIEPVAMQEAA